MNRAISIATLVHWNNKQNTVNMQLEFDNEESNEYGHLSTLEHQPTTHVLSFHRVSKVRFR